jgi:D-lactate dehydrogenase (cytochrome)
MSTEEYCSITKVFMDGENQLNLRLQPGTRLNNVNQILKKGELKDISCKGVDLDLIRRYHFAPNPTETLATFGGLFACNAKGMNNFKHGDTASNINSIEVVLANGELWEIPRGQFIFDSTGCKLPNGDKLQIDLSAAKDKSPIYCLSVFPGLDLLDLFAGSEGMLGIVTRLDVKLKKIPDHSWAIMFFFDNLSSSIEYCQKLSDGISGRIEDHPLTAVEFFHSSALQIIEQYKMNTTLLKDFPNFPSGMESAVYIEIEGQESDILDQYLEFLLETFLILGGNEEHAWAANGPYEIEKFRMVRHTAAESVNSQVDIHRQDEKTLTKVCTDFTVPTDRLADTINLYLVGINEAQVAFSIFGHALDNHFHVNLLPKGPNELKRSNQLIYEWAEQVTNWGGSIVSENGIGKLKKPVFNSFVSESELKRIIMIKEFFDPQNVLNQTNAIVNP